jgi:hypothetical protein
VFGFVGARGVIFLINGTLSQARRRQRHLHAILLKWNVVDSADELRGRRELCHL